MYFEVVSLQPIVAIEIPHPAKPPRFDFREYGNRLVSTHHHV
jgi:hypothetical protein